ncbi:MAG: hypothetical protein WC166_06950 [Bacteroidales bacterium]|jgi:TonB family protein
MNNGSNSNAKLAGITATVIFHIALLLVCFGSGLKYNFPPPEEQSILIEFEPEAEEPKPIEMAAGIEPKAPVPNPDEEIKLVQHAESQHLGNKLNETQEATVGRDGDIEVPEPPREKEINKRALFPAADNGKKKDTLAAQTSDRITDALAAGHSNGNTATGDTDGQPSAKVAGRSVMGSLPLPGYAVQKSGRVVVRITVNRDGKVTTAIPGYQGTTVTDKTLWEAAKAAALKSVFNVSQSAPLSQEGTITYIFTLK